MNEPAVERSELTAAVLAEVDRLEPELIAMCRDLVRINTVNPYAGAGPTGLEGVGQTYLRPVLEALGGRVHQFEPPPDVFDRVGVCAPRDRSWKGRPNLVTTFELGPGPRIIINSHMDTVGVAGMAFDPFCAEVRDGRIYGRGTSDDKGGMVAGIIALKAALKFRDRLGGTIIHESVVDEECSGSGAGTLACCLAGYTADEAVVIDGGGLEIIRGCGGCLTAGVTVVGRAGHAARGGVNAIDKAVIVKRGLDEFRARREAADPDALVNLGMFHAGEHPAVVPGRAELSLNIVYSIGEAAENERKRGRWSGDTVRESFERAVRSAEAGDPWLVEHPSEIEWIKDLVPFETPADAPLVRRLGAAGLDALGRSLSMDIMAAWGDAANLARYGGVPSVFFGPGTPAAAHAADESVAIRDLMDCARVVAAYLCRSLGRP
ncbi:MAG: M20/M25/M40 family metallo-hydrolase [Kiritimatiellaeota bacterium]|nr:M20/M25/M40 family metallo-hydrolase [Kiritimatiellota bacterium]